MTAGEVPAPEQRVGKRPVAEKEPTGAGGDRISMGARNGGVGHREEACGGEEGDGHGRVAHATPETAPAAPNTFAPTESGAVGCSPVPMAAGEVLKGGGSMGKRAGGRG